MNATLLNNQTVVVMGGTVIPPSTGTLRKRVKAMGYVGDFAAGAVVRIPWDTYGADGASVTRTSNGTLRIYRDNAPAERLSLSGISQVEDFDGITGTHTITIDTADNADPGFYAPGHDYEAKMVGMVIDGVTVNETIGAWSIENRTGVSGVVPPTNPSGIQKGVALPNFDFVMRNLAGLEAVGLSVTARRRLDAGAFAVCSNSVTEVGDGLYTINLSAGDLAADKVTLRFTAPGAKPTLLTIFTEP